MKNYPIIAAGLAMLAAGCKTAETAIVPSGLEIEVVRDKCIASKEEDAIVEVRITNRSSNNLVANSEHFYLGGILDENNQYVMPNITTSDLLNTSSHWDELPRDSTVNLRIDLIELRKYPLLSGRSYTLEIGYYRPKPQSRNAVKNEMPGAKARSKQIRVCL